MSKNFSSVPRSALGRALIACRDNAIALAARLLNVSTNQRIRQQFVGTTGTRADSSDELALQAWDDDGGHSGSSEVDERYEANRQAIRERLRMRDLDVRAVRATPEHVTFNVVAGGCETASVVHP